MGQASTAKGAAEFGVDACNAEAASGDDEGVDANIDLVKDIINTMDPYSPPFVDVIDKNKRNSLDKFGDAIKARNKAYEPMYKALGKE